jgi:uncharacterized protein (DUF2141 family)
MKPLVAAVAVLVALIGEGLEMTGVTKMSARARVTGLAAVTVLLMASLVWAAQGRTLKVTVNYTGNGEVSATNAVFVSVWTSPPVGDTTAPLALEVAQENGATVTFENLTASPVYLVAFYDTQGDGMVASGMPFGGYGADAYGAPSAIVVGDSQTVEVELSFDDALRIP